MTNKTCDCSNFVPKQCKAYCCGPVPVEKHVYYSNLDKRCRPVIEEVDLGDMVLPNTGGTQCVFLSESYTCSIYEDRPKTCHEFGKIDSPLMQCPFMDKHGVKRTDKEKKVVERNFYKALNEAQSS